MNRPGQPQQRPPSLAPNPALANQFRPPYPNYGLPPRNVSVLQSGGYVTGLQTNSHRASSQQSQVQSLGPQPTPGFMQQRGQVGFGFSGGLGQHQPNSLQQQQQQQLPSQQQTNGTSSSIPLHLAQTPNLGAASVTSTSEVNLDPNDFPALGSTPVNNNNSSSNSGNGAGVPTTSYASQAGLGSSSGTAPGATGIGAIASNQTRDFTPDDFPALGGQTQSQSQSSQSQSAVQDNHPHPPGLNGFHIEPPQHHRQNLLGSLSGSIQQATPGMLNLGGTQSRNVHPGFQQPQADPEKQRNNFSLKVNQTHAAWNSPNVNSSSQSQPTGATQNGTHSNQNPSTTHLNAPPGVPPPAASFSQQLSQVSHNAGTIANAAGSFASSLGADLPKRSVSCRATHKSE
ncbi:hypothetical protein AX17_006240 [Amanita inopinata Kibby_2008]|nr:hypothetical protein AX17_006240 [Amanita inopinata Kibby_2008]